MLFAEGHNPFAPLRKSNLPGKMGHLLIRKNQLVMQRFKNFNAILKVLAQSTQKGSHN